MVLTCLVSCLFPSVTSAQVVWSTAGKSFSQPQAQISQTFGEPLIQTVSQGGAQLSQGFHQPDILLTAIETHPDLSFLKVYPNPTISEVFVEGGRGLSYRIHDMNGALIDEGHIEDELHSLRFTDRAAAAYRLELQNQSALQSYKIIKTDQ